MAIATGSVVTRPDPEVAAEVQHAINLDRDVPGHIHAEVHNGEVTLTGLVHRISEKAEAEQAARTVRGVRAIRNQIEVKNGTEPPDDCC